VSETARQGAIGIGKRDRPRGREGEGLRLEERSKRGALSIAWNYNSPLPLVHLTLER